MPEEFLYTTKLWFAVHERSVFTADETGRRRLKDVFRIATLEQGGKKAVATFTDEDLAERFLEALDDPEMVPLATRTPDALIELLENLRRSGYALVAFDPVPNPVFIPLATVLGDVRREVV
jgi:hypothetical protein